MYDIYYTYVQVFGSAEMVDVNYCKLATVRRVPASPCYTYTEVYLSRTTEWRKYVMKRVGPGRLGAASESKDAQVFRFETVASSRQQYRIIVPTGVSNNKRSPAYRTCRPLCFYIFLRKEIKSDGPLRNTVARVYYRVRDTSWTHTHSMYCTVQ